MYSGSEVFVLSVSQECSNDVLMPNLETHSVSKMEMMKMKGFNGSKADLGIVKNFLDSAVVLKEMVIVGIKNEQQQTIRKELLLRFSWGSKSCKVWLSQA